MIGRTQTSKIQFSSSFYMYISKRLIVLYILYFFIYLLLSIYTITLFQRRSTENGFMLTVFNILDYDQVNTFTVGTIVQILKFKKTPLFKLCHCLFCNNRYLGQHLKECKEIVSRKLKLAVGSKEVSKQNLHQAQTKLRALENILDEVFVIL